MKVDILSVLYRFVDMERKVCFPLFAVLLFAVLNSAQAQTIESYWKVDDTLSLTPPFSGAITSILWKHNTDLVVELVGNQVDYYGKFRGMATLDTTNGRLEIKNMNRTYAGLYTVEINNQVQSQDYNVSVIKKVPKPEVAFKPLACSSDLLNCTMTCAGVTSEAGPVTYSWREGDGKWIPGGKDKSIKREETKRVETFSCRMKNPVSEEESKPQPNPFFQKDLPVGPSPGKIAGGVIGFLLVGVLAGVCYWKREPIIDFFNQRRAQAAPASENGRTAASSPNEEDPLKKTGTNEATSQS